jgi:hypothetical protein
MKTNGTFDLLLLLARPGAGKSEIIHYLKGTPVEERMQRFHVGEFEELDDFPMLWTWFEEDAILDKLGQPRLYTDAQDCFRNPYLWDVLVERIDLEYRKKLRDPHYHERLTCVAEFSRGSQHGGYRRAFAHLGSEFARRAAILYVDVSFEESRRKNRARFNPHKPDSILEHALSDAKLEKLYKDVDWFELTAADPQRVEIAGVGVPYVVFPNDDDVTTPQGDALGRRLEEKLGQLWTLYTAS